MSTNNRASPSAISTNCGGSLPRHTPVGLSPMPSARLVPTSLRSKMPAGCSCSSRVPRSRPRIFSIPLGVYLDDNEACEIVNDQTREPVVLSVNYTAGIGLFGNAALLSKRQRAGNALLKEGGIYGLVGVPRQQSHADL